MPFRPLRNLVLAALVASLGACHPIDTWRSLTGANKDDPDPATTPNSQNLAAGSKEPYPNLASVPAPPIPALTQAERDRLTTSLVADRTNARYNQERLLPGPTPAAALPPPDRRAPPSGSATGPTVAKSSVAPPRKPGEPPAPGPRESSLQPPRARENPQPEASRPPPERVTMAPAPAPAAAPIAPATIASAAPQPPPPPPSIPPPASVAMAPTPAATGPAVAHTVATIDFTTPTAKLAAADQATIDGVVAAFRAKPGTVHVVAYAAAASPGHAELDNYRAALDRGQTVAKALAEDGVPVGKISTEAAPALPGAPSGRVVIRLAS